MFLAVVFSQSVAQEVNYRLGYFGFFDNREYFNEFVNDQTIFGARISGALGVTFDKNNKVMAGIDYLYEFGSKGELLAPDILLYYKGSRKNLDFYLGAFPRLNNINMPLALMTDTFHYFRPAVEGILLNYHAGSFRHNVWIDWTGRQSAEKREMFILGFSGYAGSNLLLYQHHFVMSHLAHTAPSDTSQHLRDNAGFSALLGLNLADAAGLDSLTFSAGFLGSYDRLRGVYDFRVPFGFLAELETEYKGFGLHGIVYAGDSQVIVTGDGFYKSSFYSRADVYYQVSSAFIEGKLQFSFHFIPGVTDLSMSLVVRTRLEGAFRHHQ